MEWHMHTNSLWQGTTTHKWRTLGVNVSEEDRYCCTCQDSTALDLNNQIASVQQAGVSTDFFLILEVCQNLPKFHMPIDSLCEKISMYYFFLEGGERGGMSCMCTTYQFGFELIEYITVFCEHHETGQPFQNALSLHKDELCSTLSFQRCNSWPSRG